MWFCSYDRPICDGSHAHTHTHTHMPVRTVCMAHVLQDVKAGHASTMSGLLTDSTLRSHIIGNCLIIRERCLYIPQENTSHIFKTSFRKVHYRTIIRIWEKPGYKIWTNRIRSKNLWARDPQARTSIFNFVFIWFLQHMPGNSLRIDAPSTNPVYWSQDTTPRTIETTLVSRGSWYQS